MERQPSGAPLRSARFAQALGSRLPNAGFLFFVLVATPLAAGAPQAPDPREQTRADEALRREGEAIIELADTAMNGRATPSDFSIEWRNDFLKAQPGTFVPFTVSIDPEIRGSAGALMYVRVVARNAPAEKRGPGSPFPYETIFPLDVADGRGPIRVRRGFAVPPGSYTAYVVVRERMPDGRDRRQVRRKTSVLVQPLDIPDFWTGELTTSTVILADRVETLAAPLPPGGLEENPYVVGTTRIYPVSSPVFRRDKEMVVVFLIYNPRVGTDKHFDVQVDYHLYRKNRDGEKYVTRTNPQRFTPSMMGPYFDPASGQPVLAGQGILLSEFETGEYRLAITVTDLLSRRTVSRDVTFTVVGS